MTGMPFTTAGHTTNRVRVLRALRLGALHVDSLSARLALTKTALARVLTRLHRAGEIANVGPGEWELTEAGKAAAE